MWNRFKLSITQHFLVFFFITALLPMGFISTLLFQSIDNKFNERIARMLDIGGLFAEEVYQTDLEKLSLSLNQAANFSLNRYYLNIRDSEQMNQALRNYQKLQQLDYVALYDSAGGLLFSSGWSNDLSNASYRNLLKEALLGRPVRGTERIEKSDKKVQLVYTALAPIKTPNGKVTGVLMAAETVSRNFSFQDLIRAFPGLDMRIYVKSADPENFQLVYTSMSNTPALMPTREISRFRHYPPRRLSPVAPGGSVLSEKIIGESLKSKAITLRNSLKEPIGYLIVSSSETDLRELKSRNIYYFLLYVLFGFAIAGITGAWFKQKLINPFNALFRASEEVSRGNFDTHITEISDQYEIQRTLSSFNKMVSQLHEDEKLRSTFVSTLTHDLRTPLIAQKRVLKVYDRYGDELPEEIRRMNRQLLRNNDNLLDMVNKLLESYQYEAGKVLLVPDYFHVDRLIHECCDEVRLLAEEKNITLTLDVSKQMSQLYADRHQIKRVFQNLIGNALENIDDNKRVTVVAREERDTFRFEVTDNGPGISEELLSNLFTRYFTGNRLRQKIGSGLGLYICRMIVELHDGEISAHSKVGVGTTVMFRIPKNTGQEGAEP